VTPWKVVLLVAAIWGGILVMADPAGHASASTFTWYVTAGAPAGGDGSVERPFGTVNEALNVAQAGHTISVGPGTYSGTVTTVRPGTSTAPIIILGQDARLVGNGTGRLVNIDHSYITLEGFDISNADKGIWVQQAQGVRIINNTVHDLGGECIRLKYFASSNEVAGNRIGPCGLVNFNLSTGSKNGEGIYIGTAPEQLDRNPTPEPDQSNSNSIHDNQVTVPAECVDIKEASTDNVVSNNTCSGSKDPDGAGFGSRGNGNFFRGNTASGGDGAGVRLGGDTSADGIDNTVEGNTLINNAGYGVKVMRLPQRSICGNTVTGNGSGATTSGAPDPTAPCTTASPTPSPTISPSPTPSPSTSPTPSDTTAPTVSSTSPSGGATNVAINTNVSATFSEDMDPGTLTSSTVTLAPDGSTTPLSATVSYDAGTRSVTLDPSANLGYSRKYKATVKGGSGGAKDKAGNPLAADKVWIFTTQPIPDTTAPTVTSVSPANGASSVNRTITVTAKFSEQMDPATLTNSTVMLVPDGTTTPVSATVTYDAATRTVRLKPSSTLASSTRYTATVKGGAAGAKDKAGNPLAADKIWSFRTRR
jgi:hypothetical protein